MTCLWETRCPTSCLWGDVRHVSGLTSITISPCLYCIFGFYRWQNCKSKRGKISRKSSGLTCLHIFVYRIKNRAHIRYRNFYFTVKIFFNISYLGAVIIELKLQKLNGFWVLILYVRLLWSVIFELYKIIYAFLPLYLFLIKRKNYPTVNGLCFTLWNNVLHIIICPWISLRRFNIEGRPSSFWAGELNFDLEK